MNSYVVIYKLGSTTFRVQVYEHRNGEWIPIAKKGVVLERATGLDSQCLDGPAAMVALNELRTSVPAGPVRCFALATGLFRFAPNAPAILGAIEATLGTPVQVISDQDEAAIARLVVQRATGATEFALIDIGGGTTEVSLPDRETLSLRLGTVSVVTSPLEQVLPVPPMGLASLRHTCLQVLKQAALPDLDGMTLIGVGGTLEAYLHLIRKSSQVSSGSVSREEISTTMEQVASLTEEEIRALPGVNPHRIQMLVPGGMIMIAVMDSLQADRVNIVATPGSEGMLRWLLQNGALQT